MGGLGGGCVWEGCDQRCAGLSVFVVDRQTDGQTNGMHGQRDGGTEGPNDRQRQGLKKTSSQKHSWQTLTEGEKRDKWLQICHLMSDLKDMF